MYTLSMAYMFQVLLYSYVHQVHTQTEVLLVGASGLVVQMQMNIQCPLVNIEN